MSLQTRTTTQSYMHFWSLFSLPITHLHYPPPLPLYTSLHMCLLHSIANFNVYSCSWAYSICDVSNLPKLGPKTLLMPSLTTSSAHRGGGIEVNMQINVYIQCCSCSRTSCCDDLLFSSCCQEATHLF